jgi:hypothetical protein
MNAIFLSVRALHVLLGAIWLGAAVLMTYFVLPSVEDAGPDGGKVVMALLRRQFAAFVASVSGLTVVTGFWLYWHFTAGFDPALSATPGAMVFGTGGLLGFIAAGLTSAIVIKNIKRAAALMKEAEGTSDITARATLLSQAVHFRRKAGGAGRIVALMLVVTIILMAIGHYV